jgi:peptidyl-prolyl cis-trans isomerase D
MRTYTERQSRYATPERRDVQQIVFTNADEAKKASERLAGGLSFDDLAKERNLTDKDTDLGTVTKADILDAAVANAAFGLAEGAVSAPVAGRFGTVIVHVTKIEPASTKSFNEVEADIKHDIALDRAKDEVNKIRDKIDEEFGGGARLDEIAQKLNIPLRTIEAVDRTGHTPDGQMVGDLPPGPDVINAAFATDIGNENDPLPVTGGGFVWYDVANITPARDRTLDEAKDRVEMRWREEETVKRLDAQTAEIMDKLKSGTPLADVATAEQATLETKSGLKRESTDPLPARAVATVFKTAKDAFGSAEGKSPTDRIIFQVTDIKIPNFDAAAPTAQGINNDLKNAYNLELMGQYVTRLENDLGIKINEAALSQAVGRTPSNQ